MLNQKWRWRIAVALRRRYLIFNRAVGVIGGLGTVAVSSPRLLTTLPSPTVSLVPRFLGTVRIPNHRSGPWIPFPRPCLSIVSPRSSLLKSMSRRFRDCYTYILYIWIRTYCYYYEFFADGYAGLETEHWRADGRRGERRRGHDRRKFLVKLQRHARSYRAHIFVSNHNGRVSLIITTLRGFRYNRIIMIIIIIKYNICHRNNTVVQSSCLRKIVIARQLSVFVRYSSEFEFGN